MKSYTKTQYYKFYKNFNRGISKEHRSVPKIEEKWRDCNNVEFRGVLCDCVRWFEEFRQQISAYNKCSNCLSRGFPPISMNDLT